MSLQTLSLALACLGTILASGNQVQRWFEKRAADSVDEHRLDVEGLRTLAGELRLELDRSQQARELAEQKLDQEREERRSERRLDRQRIADLEGKVAELGKDLRQAHDVIDQIKLEREMRRP